MTKHKDTDNKKGLSADDIDLWRDMTRDVTLMEGREYFKADETLETFGSSKDSLNAQTPPTYTPAKQDTPKPSKAYKGRDVDGNTLRKLQRGEIDIDGKIDLHGMNQGQARQALISYILGAYHAGKRCILVVTGKGNTGRTSEDWMTRTPGVLKQKTPVWLFESELSGIVLKTVPARQRHGGDGALYVYLRRQRD